MKRQQAAMTGLVLTLGALATASCDSGRDVLLVDGRADSGDGRLPDASGDGDDSAGDGDGDGDSDTCAWADATTERVPTTLWFVISYSTRMLFQTPPSISPWDRLQNTLFGPQGKLAMYEDAFRFGAVFHGDDPSAASCPTLTTLAPKLGNAAEIASQAALLAQDPQSPLGGYALRYVASAPPPPEGKVAVVMTRGEVLGSDGACIKDIPQGERQYGVTLAYEGARELAALGIPLFVLEFGTETRVSESSKMLAELGNTGHEAFFVPPSTATGDELLDEVFQTILSESVSCEFQLNGKVVAGYECAGEVSVDGRQATCGDANGWRLKDESTVELVGQACKDLRASESAQVKARFPCNAFELF